MVKVLQGSVAIVTGASSGIGAATASTLSALGASVALVARRKDRLESLADSLDKNGTNTLVIESDISDEKQATIAIEKTVAEFGRLDTLVNNAGLMLLGPALTATPSDWVRMVEVNLLGAMYCAHAALPHLLKSAETSPRRVADMVNISSTAGRYARNGTAAYNATKFGLNGFTESLRQEFAKKHVRISVVEPGFVQTELQSHNSPEVLTYIQEILKDIEGLQAQDIADAVEYIVTRKRHIAVNEMLIRPTEQQA